MYVNKLNKKTNLQVFYKVSKISYPFFKVNNKIKTISPRNCMQRDRVLSLSTPQITQVLRSILGLVIFAILIKGLKP